MFHCLRMAITAQSFDKLDGGDVGVDESHIGGRAVRCTPASAVGLECSGGRSLAGKIAVMALLARHGKGGHSVVRTEVLQNVRKDQ